MCIDVLGKSWSSAGAGSGNSRDRRCPKLGMFDDRKSRAEWNQLPGGVWQWLITMAPRHLSILEWLGMGGMILY